VPNVHGRIAHNIRQLAKAKKIPTTHLADRSGISRAELFNILNGTKSPTVRLLIRVAAALEVDIVEFFRPNAGAIRPNAGAKR
jgi:transcriptional regulator with XRE-family HTH domain